MAWAAATAPLDGTELLLAAWPAEITTTLLPVDAARAVSATGRFVPLKASWVAASALAGWSDPSPPPVPVVLPVDVVLLELHAAAMSKATSTSAIAPRRVLLTRLVM